MLDTHPQWIALYTKPRAEHQVAARLEEKGIEAYVPTTRKARKWSDRVKMVDVAIFPSYTFARITSRQVVPVRGMLGVVVPIAFGGEIATIPDNDIEVIRKALQEKKDFIVESTQKMRKGSKVRVKAGTFEGCEGLLVKDAGECNFVVEIKALSSRFCIKLDNELLELLPDDSNPQPQRKKYNF